MLQKLFCFSLFVLVNLFSFVHAENQSGAVFLTNASVEDILKSVEGDGKPILVLCTLYDNSEYTQMEADIMSDRVATTYIQQHFHAYKFDAFEDIENTQYWDIQHFPTFLIIGKDGKILDRLEGVINSKQLVGELNGWHERGEKNNPDFRGFAFGKRNLAEVYYKDLEEYKQYSLEKAGGDGYGLRIGTYTTKDALRAELGKVMKFWKSEITVYSQRDKRKEVYCLVLGDYDDFEDAQEMQKIVYEKNLIFAPIIPFNTITNTFIETVSPLRE